jgi:hypothetical protein
MNKKRMMSGSMKKFIWITFVFMLMLILLGCFPMMAPQQHEETHDMRGYVGNKPFAGSVGSTFTYDRWGFIESTPY